MNILLLIVIINILYMSFFTLRLILIIKEYRIIASVVSMLEVFIYLMGLSIVLENLDKPINIVAYCLGWAIGVYAGSKIEERLALGYIVFEIVLDECNMDIADKLRSQGYGVTSWLANGREGKRVVMKVLTKRRNESKFYHYITSEYPNAFIISYEPTHFKGGFLVKALQK